MEGKWRDVYEISPRMAGESQPCADARLSHLIEDHWAG